MLSPRATSSCNEQPTAALNAREKRDCLDWGNSPEFTNLTIFANLRVLALPMSVHDGEDQKDLNQPNMHF
jgi:hypothetical protein